MASDLTTTTPQNNGVADADFASSPSFFKELKELDEKGLPSVYDRILVSDRVHIDLQLHVAADGLEEKELGGWSQGFLQPQSGDM